MRKIMTIYGTRPEAIKVAPVIKALDASERFVSLPVVTGQHREMLDQVNDLFDITPLEDLEVMTAGQTLNAIVAKVVAGVDRVLEEHTPDAVIVQGDTSTVMGAAVAAFNRRIPVVHLEAGLRSGDIDSPFPEEANRKLTTQITRLHLAPTHQSRDNLLREGVSAQDVIVTGNSVIDALLTVVGNEEPFRDPELQQLVSGEDPVVLVTTHRRENLGQHMVDIGKAVRRLALEHPEYRFVFPVHRNPLVREALLPQVRDLQNTLLLEPLGYADFARLIGRSRMVLTDSGGVQEEAPSLGKPVLVLRENTERPEAVEAGTVRLVGTDPERIYREATLLIEDERHFAAMANAVNPYGDGMAAERTEAALAAMFGLGDRLPDFESAG